MQKAVMAALHHSVKQDDSAPYQYYPDGDDEKSSWCEYKKMVAWWIRATTSMFLASPTLKRLSERELLLKCLPGHTQNQNESFNSVTE